MWQQMPLNGLASYLRLFGKSTLASWYLPVLQRALQNVSWEAKLIRTCRVGKNKPLPP